MERVIQPLNPTDPDLQGSSPPIPTPRDMRPVATPQATVQSPSSPTTAASTFPTEDSQPSSSSPELHFGTVSQPSEAPAVRMIRRNKNLLIMFVVAIILAAGWFTIKTVFASIRTYEFTSGDHTYSLDFYRGATVVKLTDGIIALKAGDKAVAGVKPTTSIMPKACASVGSGWTEAFHLTVNNNDTLICSAIDFAYASIITDKDQRYMVTVTFKEKQKEDIYPILRKIFASFRVTQ